MLEWPSRAASILAEIQEADADIVTLQELNHYGGWGTRRVQCHEALGFKAVGLTLQSLAPFPVCPWLPARGVAVACSTDLTP